MAKGVRGSSPREEDKPKRTTLIMQPAVLKKIKRIAFEEETEMTKIVDQALNDYITKYEKKHGPVPVK
jgi:hypothetical protein